MKEFKVPGFSMVVIRNDRIAWRQVFGVKDASSRAPVTYATMFEAASMSKPVFAYAVMRLAQKGTIDLDAPLTKYTSKKFLEGDPRLDLITARRVLSHTTGFPTGEVMRSRSKSVSLPARSFRIPEKASATFSRSSKDLLDNRSSRS